MRMSRIKSRKHPKFLDQERCSYLQELKEEFLSTKSLSAKHETIANLANFAYNPENHCHFFNLSIHEVFMENIDCSDDFISVASIKGLTNLAPNPMMASYLSQNDSMNKIQTSLMLKKHLIDLVINGLLLLATIKHLNINIEEKLKIAMNELAKNMSQNSNDNRIQNYCKIIISD